jgi:hypothetical protein
VVGSSWALLPTGSALGNVEVSSRRCRGLTTRGVRADRVGIKLSRHRPKGWSRAEAPAAKACRLLARETSTGGRPRGRMGFRPRSAKVPGRPQGLPGAGEMAPPVLGAGSAVVEQGFGLARGLGPTATREQRRRVKQATRASARWQRSWHQRRGSDDPAVVLAGCVGCRNRRAAPGPDREVMGLARWLTRSRVRAQRVNGRRKPGRGGESHEHASSDTGGGLLVIPRAARESAVRDRGREHSAMEGVLIRRKPPSLTRRRESRVW